MRDQKTHAAPTRDEVSEALRGQPHQFIDVGHCALACWSFGQGPDLVFVHGWPLTGATFRAFVPLLADRFTCHLFDLPGIGKTRWDEGSSFGIHTNTEAVLKVVEALGLDSYALVAHDSGGTIARLVAARDKGRVRGLVLGDTELPAHRLLAFEIGQKLASLPGASRVMRAMMGSKRVCHSKAFFGGCFGDTEFIEGDFRSFFIEPLVASKRATEGQLNFARHVEWSVLDTLEEVHRQIEAPTLLVWGEQDRIFPLAGARQMLDQFPAGVTLEVIPDASLFVHEEKTEVFVGCARPFLMGCFDLDQAAPAS